MLPSGQAFDDLTHPPRVLLVDDDEVNLLLTAAALRERGFDVTEANSGGDALAHLSARTPDVVVLDALVAAAGGDPGPPPSTQVGTPGPASAVTADGELGAYTELVIPV